MLLAMEWTVKSGELPLTAVWFGSRISPLQISAMAIVWRRGVGWGVWIDGELPPGQNDAHGFAKPVKLLHGSTHACARAQALGA